LYFESIYPYEDGNGRIGMSIAEKVLFESLNTLLLLSISTVTEKNRKAYCSAL
jgi:Fic family protein